MNGAHDLGGMQGLGPIPYEKSEPVFHAPWEGRLYAINRAIGLWRKWNGYTSRYQKELIPPADYFRMSYYERWYVGLVELLVQSKLVTRGEIDTGRPAAGSTKATPPLKAEEVVPMFTKPGFARREPAGAPPRFQPGQRVRARNMHPVGHTRLPRYARGKQGTVERDYGTFAFPDAIAHSLPDRPQHVYSVRFAARELWGEQSKAQDAVYIDMWDDYLEPI